jgi:hypothetical protein
MTCSLYLAVVAVVIRGGRLLWVSPYRPTARPSASLERGDGQARAVMRICDPSADNPLAESPDSPQRPSRFQRCLCFVLLCSQPPGVVDYCMYNYGASNLAKNCGQKNLEKTASVFNVAPWILRPSLCFCLCVSLCSLSPWRQMSGLISTPLTQPRRPGRFSAAATSTMGSAGPNRLFAILTYMCKSLHSPPFHLSTFMSPAGFPHPSRYTT